MSKLLWTGPFRVRDLLARCLDDAQPWPPKNGGAYVISRRSWKDVPGPSCRPLYIGGTTGGSARFCTRIGDLVADMHGLYDGGTGHHSGGQSLYVWCAKNNVHPGSLYIGWAQRRPACNRCIEIDIAKLFVSSWAERRKAGLLNKNRPPSCAKHSVNLP